VEEAEEDDKTILQAPQRSATAVLSRLDDFRSLPVSLTNDPVGLQVLHQPDAPHVVDIIFVHGLGGGSRTTWTQHQDPEFLWPLKFLPHESEINEARISTFGYHTDLKKASIFELAKALLVDLKHAEDAITKQPLAIGKRPIIFVAHSLGGLIVKEVIIRRVGLAYD
jgi:pimeloyl-ACP methyl ester carboxylesterase